MTTPPQPSLDLTRLRMAFPEYEITEDASFKPPKYHAVALKAGTSPYAVITDSLPELLLSLAAGSGDQLGWLRRAFPGWDFTDAWITAGSGPDGHVLFATRDNVTIRAFSASALVRNLASLAAAPADAR